MARHKGTYTPENPEPYELSRSKMEMFIRCEACFWLEKVAGVKQPGMPGFLVNSSTDLLLKREMDNYQGKKRTLLLTRITAISFRSTTKIWKIGQIHFNSALRQTNTTHFTNQPTFCLAVELTICGSTHRRANIRWSISRAPPI